MGELNISIAERVARNLHAQGRQISVMPTIKRIEKLVEHFKSAHPHAPNYAIDAVWLKNIMADFKVSKEWLSFQGITQSTIEILQNIIASNDKNYKTHIEKICNTQHEWTIKVKLIEITHELSPDYSKKVNASAINQLRYMPAQAKLTEAIKKLDENCLILTEDMRVYLKQHEVTANQESQEVSVATEHDMYVDNHADNAEHVMGFA